MQWLMKAIQRLSVAKEKQYNMKMAVWWKPIKAIEAGNENSNVYTINDEMKKAWKRRSWKKRYQ